MAAIRWLPRAALFAASSASSAWAQSCAMCYASASAAKGGGITALQHGIIILLFPPLLIFMGICIAAYRNRH
jgi:hypothetical protein